MLSKDIIKKIRHIEITTKRMLSGSLAGDYTVAQKGFGLEFDQLREYQQGDDVRFIDWHSSARMNKLLVKQYLQDRSRTVMLVVDISDSSFYGSGEFLKYDIMAQVASVLALVADYGKDRVSLTLFSDDVDVYFSPKQGRPHIHKIMRHLFEQKSYGKKTDFGPILKHLALRAQKDAIVFFISDVIDHHFEKNVKHFSRLHDVVVIRCLDALEQHIPALGAIQVQDIETGNFITLDALSNDNNDVNAQLEKRLKMQQDYFNKYGIDCIDFYTHKPFIADLIRFFRRRMMY